MVVYLSVPTQLWGAPASWEASTSPKVPLAQTEAFHPTTPKSKVSACHTGHIYQYSEALGISSALPSPPGARMPQQDINIRLETTSFWAPVGLLSWERGGL